MIKELYKSIYDVCATIIPIVFIVAVLMLFIPIDLAIRVSFFMSAVLLIIGSILFTFGAELSMVVIGNKIGRELIRSKKVWLILLASFVIGTVVTIAEPDLLVLVEQITSIPNSILVITISVGVGIFLMLAAARSLYGFSLNTILIVSFILIFILMALVPNEIVAFAFDSGGVTTGTISIPFVLTLGMGLAANRIDKKAKENSFGLIGLASTGPILMVLLLGLVYGNHFSFTFDNSIYTNFAFGNYVTQLVACFKDVLMAIAPIVVLFIIFYLLTKKVSIREMHKIILGTVLTIIGLTLFLVACNVGFLNTGYYIGEYIAGSDYKYLLVPIIMVIAFFIAIAEPAVVILIDKVEEFTEGEISKKMLNVALAIGVSLAAGLSIVRIFTQSSFIIYALIGYGIALLLMMFIPKVFTAIAFDAGGATGGSLTTALLLPIAIGACLAVEGNVYRDAFGLASLVSLVPIITVEFVGLMYGLKLKLLNRVENLDDAIIDYDWEVANG